MATRLYIEPTEQGWVLMLTPPVYLEDDEVTAPFFIASNALLMGVRQQEQ